MSRRRLRLTIPACLDSGTGNGDGPLEVTDGCAGDPVIQAFDERGIVAVAPRARFAAWTWRLFAAATKGHRDRSLPIATELTPVLKKIARHPDGRIFHGRHGGMLKPDTVRNILIREVLEPLAKRLPKAATMKGFRDGRLHSFRHYFCSMSATSNVPEQILMSWLGHQDSKMVRHYYHLHDKPSQEQMARLKFIETKPAEKPDAGQPSSETRPA